MSIREAMEDLGDAIIDEMSEVVWHIPTIRAPNMEPIEDPARPRYEVGGVFDRNQGGSRRHEAQIAVNHKGGHNPTAVLPQPQVTFRASDLRWPIMQGDHFLIDADGQMYRALTPERSMAGLVRVPLQQLGAPSYGS